MFRLSLLLLSAATLSACATSGYDKTNKDMDSQPVITETEMAPMADELMVETAISDPNLDMDITAPKPVVEEVAVDAAEPELENLYYVAQTKWEMMKFVEAVNAADLATALEADGAMTVFAPTTDAFTQAGDVEASAELLKGHIVAGKMMAADLIARAAKGETKLPTLAGTDLTLYVMGDAVKIADASGRLYTVISADNEANNGVLHQINGVLLGK